MRFFLFQVEAINPIIEVINPIIEVINPIIEAIRRLYCDIIKLLNKVNTLLRDKLLAIQTTD